MIQSLPRAVPVFEIVFPTHRHITLFASSAMRLMLVRP